MSRASRRITENAQEHLEPGEQVQGAFAGQTAIRFQVTDRYRTVVATDRRLLIFDSGTFSQTSCTTLMAELPRETAVGPPSGLLWHRLDLIGEVLHVHRRYFSEVAAIDAAAPSASTT
ncbi:hypothetical protein [Nocardioides sp. Leaf285]|uniref:hypothetical protein n=1 Tax=Nocardioides sp. Leaf285 TaxID=1736322 RepID=UPI0007036C26|nr:hypothetical protein [Nocardioides sp. Leaf285]KQP63528.1 hypothetical protein ASF47_15855 [Nocardioides sp. Leaf285]